MPEGTISGLMPVTKPLLKGGNPLGKATEPVCESRFGIARPFCLGLRKSLERTLPSSDFLFGAPLIIKGRHVVSKSKLVKTDIVALIEESTEAKEVRERL